jgi:hypothetical protein
MRMREFLELYGPGEFIYSPKDSGYKFVRDSRTDDEAVSLRAEQRAEGNYKLPPSPVMAVTEQQDD